MSAAILVTVLCAGGVYLILQRGLMRAAIGFVLIGHAANVIILAAGGQQNREPAYIGDDVPAGGISDPLLQAFTLTAIVITFALTVYMFALAGHGGDQDGVSSDAEPVDVSAVDDAGERAEHQRHDGDDGTAEDNTAGPEEGQQP